MSLSSDIKQIRQRLEAMFEKLAPISNRLYAAGAVEYTDVADVSGRISENMRDLDIQLHGIEDLEKLIKSGDADGRDKIAYQKAKTLYNRAKNLLVKGEQVFQQLKNFKPTKEDEPEEKPKPKPKKKLVPSAPKKATPPPVKVEEEPDEPDPIATKEQSKGFTDITETIEKAIERFNRKIPASQRAMLEEIELQLRRLDVRGDTIKATVQNLKIVNSIKAKLARLIMTDEYKGEVKEFVKAFNTVTGLQNEYWRGIERTFKPRPLLREIRRAAIGDTVKALGEAGIGNAIAETISDILRTNITTGGSMKQLSRQVRQALMDTPESPGLLSKYAKQITTDSIQQFNRTYTNTVSGDLGYEFFAYQGSDITTTRSFCDAMTDRRYFHISEVPSLLRADDLYYEKDGVRKKVEIYPKTKLPYGMIEGTNPENFFIRAGGYNCQHAIRPVSEGLVRSQSPIEYERIINTSAYKRWKS